MNNADTPLAPVPLELLGGLYTEATPETLPLGASPVVINCDFILGSVLIRPGKQSVFYFGNIFVQKITNFASSVADAGSTGETAWTNPTNATKNIPGTETTVSLNFSSGGGGAPAFDQVAQSSGSGLSGSVGPITPNLPKEWALAMIDTGGTIAPTDPSWAQFGGGFSDLYAKLLPATLAPVTFAWTIGGSVTYQAAMLTFFTNGSAPVSAQGSSNSVNTFNGTCVQTFPSNTVNGNSILVVIFGLGTFGGPVSIVDGNGNVYAILSSQNAGGRFTIIALAQNIIGGNHTQVTVSGVTGVSSGTVQLNEITNLAAPPPSGPTSQELQCINFSFSIPSSQQILGFEVLVSGNQSDATATSGIKVALISPAVGSPTFFGQLPSSDGTMTFGTPLANWGLAPLLNTIFNNPNFGVQIQAVAPGGLLTTFSIYAVQIKVFLTPNPPPNFNYIKTFAETGGEVLTLVLGRRTPSTIREC